MIRIEAFTSRLKNRMSLPRKSCGRLEILLGCLLWGISVAAGLVILWNYETTPGAIGAPVRRWPSASRISRDSKLPTLIMFAHPHCPCTRASIGELDKLMARCEGLVTTRLMFFKSPGYEKEWVKTDLWHQAEAIPGVTVICDEAGTEAERFQAATSGTTLLYDAQGDLLFRGGITASRGHSGDNIGLSALVSLLTQKTTDQSETFVFGCPLFDPKSSCNQGSEECDR